MNEPKFCPFCGRGLISDALFCVQCRRALPAGAEGSSSSTTKTQPNENAVAVLKYAGAAFAAIVILLVVGVGYATFSDRKGLPNPVAPLATGTPYVAKGLQQNAGSASAPATPYVPPWERATPAPPAPATPELPKDPFLRAAALTGLLRTVQSSEYDGLSGYGFDLLNNAAFARAYRVLLNGSDGSKLSALPGLLLDRATETPSQRIETPHGTIIVAGVCWPHDCGDSYGWYVYELGSGSLSAWLYHDGTATFVGDWQNPDIPAAVILLRACTHYARCGNTADPVFPLEVSNRYAAAVGIAAQR